MGTHLFAIPLLTVKEVIQRPEVTSVPNMPATFEGMMNLRGQILGVFNVRKKLGAAARDKNEASAEIVVVIESGGVMVGMLVDEVNRVLHATTEMMRTAPLKDNDPAKEFVAAVIQDKANMILILEVSKLLELDKYKMERKAS